MIVEENFLLKDEIYFCLESLSLNCLSKSSTLNLNIKNSVPDKLSGNIFKFRLAMQCISEYVMKYCQDGIIEYDVDFLELT